MAQLFARAVALVSLVGYVHGLAPGSVHAGLSRRNALALGASLPAIFLGRGAFAAEPVAPAAVNPATCKPDCFKECNTVAPGNQGYCASQCDNFCDEAAKADPIENDSGVNLPPQTDLEKNLCAAPTSVHRQHRSAIAAHTGHLLIGSLATALAGVSSATLASPTAAVRRTFLLPPLERPGKVRTSARQTRGSSQARWALR